MAPVIPGQLPASATRVCPAPMGDGVARRVPRASHADSESLPAPAAGTGVGAVRGQMRSALAGRTPCSRLMIGFGKGAAPFCPSASLGFGARAAFWADTGVLDRDRLSVQAGGVSRGLHPALPQSCHFCAWKSCRQPGRAGTRKATVFGSREWGRICLGPLGPHSLLFLVQEAELFPPPQMGGGAGGGGEGLRSSGSDGGLLE